jgi:ubiquinone/menaquinone biosynthesis C-methylase UbiE
MQPNADKGYKGIGMEGQIAAWYARNTARDMPDFEALAQRVTATLPAGSRILEVAPGPGYLAIEIARRGAYQVTGLDISHTFVEIAIRNARLHQADIDFRQGNASEMAFPENSFDFILCRAAFKNFSQPVAAMNEMHRVLKPGGRALIIDLRKDASMDDIGAYIKQSNLSWVNAIIYKVTFRYLLLPRAYSRQEFLDMASNSAFAGARIDASEIGFEVTLEKRANTPHNGPTEPFSEHHLPVGDVSRIGVPPSIKDPESDRRR